jgi:uncharacterized protein
MDFTKLKYQFHYPKLAEYVEYMMSTNPCGHDFWHVYRVCEMSAYLADVEGLIDDTVKWVELLALTHDLFDDKVVPLTDQPRVADTINEIMGDHYPMDTWFNIAALQYAASSLRWSNTGALATPYEKIVMDADRLDAIGAIGVIRAAAYGGAHGNLMYDADASEIIYTSGVTSRSTISHFYDKLQFVKDRIFTEAAKPIACERHQFMMRFLEQFKLEIDTVQGEYSGM